MDNDKFYVYDKKQDTVLHRYSYDELLLAIQLANALNVSNMILNHHKQKRYTVIKYLEIEQAYIPGEEEIDD